MTDPGIILKLDQARREAMIRADVPALAAMFADDLMWIHGNGRVHTKADVLGEIGSGTRKYLVIEPADETLRFYGGLAFLSGVISLRADIGGQIIEGQNRYTIVWAPDGDGWKVVNWQSTSVPKVA